MKNKLLEYFCAKTAFFTALSLLIAAFSVGVADGQALRSREKSVRPEAVFTNSAAITVSSGDQNAANPYPSTINVSGLTGNISTTPGSVKVTLNNFSHTYPQDLGIVLVGPTGAALLLMDFVTTGQDAENVTFTISDTGSTRLPQSAAIAPGTYKPTGYFDEDNTSFPAPGPGTNYQHPGPARGGTATFSSVFGGTNPNGDWKLFMVDFAPGDGGSISGGWTLEIITGGGGTPQVFDNRLDFFGNGFSDWAVLAGAEPDYLVWRIAKNENPTPSAPGAASINQAAFGSISLDFNPNNFFSLKNLPAFGDYTGDGKTDYAIWREGAQSLYWIHRSEDNSAFNIPWGMTGDSAGFEGDYDGDGRLDPTVIRPEEGVLRWYVLRSGTNTFSTFRFGSVNDTPLVGADYTGDGADDPAVVRLDASNRILWLTGTTSGALINKITWGSYNTDYIIPAGDYDGDGKADYAVWRGFGSAPAANGEWLILKSTGGVINIPFGIAAPDGAENRDIALRSGDYDGDDKTDIAIWRPSNQTFYVLRSSDSQVMVQKWGDPGNIPLARYGTF